MAEAFRSALGLQERPASSYYLLPERAEGQPVLNMQEKGEEVAPEERVEQQQVRPQGLMPWQLPRPRRFEPASRPDSPAVNLERLNGLLAAEDAVIDHHDEEEHVPLAQNFPNVQPQELHEDQAEVLHNRNIHNEGILFPQPPLPPPPVAVQPPKDATIAFYGLEHRADSFHNGRTGLEVGVADINGQLTLDIDKDVGTLRRYAVGVKDGSIAFNLNYFSNSNGNLIQRRPAAAQTSKPEGVLLQYESVGQGKRRDAAQWSLVATNFFHVLTCGAAVVIFMLWAFPLSGAQEMHISGPGPVPTWQTVPDFQSEDPVIFVHNGYVYPTSQIAGARIDIDVESVVHFGQAAVTLATFLTGQKEYRNISSHASVTGHAAIALQQKLHVVETKTNAAATSLGISNLWVPKQEHLQNKEETALLKAKLVQAQANLKVAPPPPNTSSSRGKRDLFGMVEGVFSTFVDGVLSMFHLTSNRHMEESLQNLEYHERKMDAKFIDFERNITKALETLMRQRLTFERFSATYHLLTIVLGDAEIQLDALLDNLNHVVKGELSSYIISPTECVEVYKRVKAAAARRGLEPAVQNPLQLLSTQVSTFSTNTSLIVILHVHLVDPNLRFNAYAILSMPFLTDNQVAYKFDIKAEIIAVQPGIASKAKHMLITPTQRRELCLDFGKTAVCHVPVRTHTTCAMALFRQLDHQCNTERVVINPPQMVWKQGAKTYLFLAVPTSVYLKCPNSKRQTTQKGLVSIFNHFGCEISTEEFIVHPHKEVEMTVVKAPERSVVSVDVLALERAKEEIRKAPPNSLDNLVDGLQEEVNKTSKYHEQWSPHTPGRHDYIQGGLSLFAWVVGTILVIIFLRVTYKKGQARLAVQQPLQPAPVQFGVGQGVILPSVNPHLETPAASATTTTTRSS